MKVVNNQLQALAKLQPSDEPVLVTWSVRKISQEVIAMYRMANREFELLEVATGMYFFNTYFKNKSLSTEGLFCRK